MHVDLCKHVDVALLIRQHYWCYCIVYWERVSWFLSVWKLR